MFVIGTIISVILWVVFSKKKHPKIKKTIDRDKNISTSNETPRSSGNNEPARKSGSVATTIFTLIGILLFILLLFWVIKVGINTLSGVEKFFEPKPKHRTEKVLVEVKKINLLENYNDANCIHLNDGQSCKFINATVPFCAINEIEQEVCGDAYTDPDLPSGSQNKKMYFKKRDNSGVDGTIEVHIYSRKSLK